MIVNLDVSYTVPEANRKPGAGATEKNETLTYFLIDQALQKKYPPSPGQQLGEIKSREERKIVARIQKGLIKAVNAGTTKADFQRSDLVWLHEELLQKWECPPGWAGYLDDLDENMRELFLAEKRDGSGEK